MSFTVIIEEKTRPIHWSLGKHTFKLSYQSWDQFIVLVKLTHPTHPTFHSQVKSGPLLQSDLISEDSFIVDNGDAGIWVWVGRRASKKERTEAMRNAQGFIKKKGKTLINTYNKYTGLGKWQ